MALIAVLWIVAALSVMVTGVTSTVRQQIQVAGLQRDQASGQALGQAAIALALQAMQAAREPVPGVTSVSVPYAGQQIAVEVAPLNGLIPLNGAGADLLAALLRVAGGLAPAPAQALATALVEWRDGRPAGDAAGADARQRQFEAPEDLLLVPGVDYALYARPAPIWASPAASTPRPRRPGCWRCWPMATRRAWRPIWASVPAGSRVLTPLVSKRPSLIPPAPIFTACAPACRWKQAKCCT